MSAGSGTPCLRSSASTSACSRCISAVRSTHGADGVAGVGGGGVCGAAACQTRISATQGATCRNSAGPSSLGPPAAAMMPTCAAASTTDASLIGTAKPTAVTSSPNSLALATPTTSPASFTTGPPEFPGFTAASVWKTFTPPRGAIPETTPRVTLTPAPSSCSRGKPITLTSVPTSTREESASGSVGSPVAWIAATARSCAGSAATTVATYALPPRATSTLPAPATTWLQVSRYPLGLTTNPVPVDVCAKHMLEQSESNKT